MAESEWCVLMTDSASAAASPVLSPEALEMLRVEGELEALGIPVGWDPFRPGEGFTSFYTNVSFPRSLRMLVPSGRLKEAQSVVDSLCSGREDST